MIIKGYFFLSLNENICCFSMKTYAVGTHLNCLIEMVQMSMFSLKDKENYPSIISNLLLLSGLLAGNKTYSLQILNCTAPGQD